MVKIIRFDNCRMVINDALEVHRFYEGNGLNYEGHVRQELLRVVPQAKVMWDIGANAGLHTISAKQIKPDLRVVCFEPSVSNLACLVQTVALNGWDDVTVIPMAVSDVTGLVGINACPDNPCCGKHGQHFEHYQPAIALDDLALPLPDVVKMDVEGWELHVLRGAKQLLAAKPVFITELNLPLLERNSSPVDYIDHYLSHGFAVTILDYMPGMRMQVRSGVEAVQHVLRTSGAMADIVAEPA